MVLVVLVVGYWWFRWCSGGGGGGDSPFKGDNLNSCMSDIVTCILCG